MSDSELEEDQRLERRYISRADKERPDDTQQRYHLCAGDTRRPLRDRGGPDQWPEGASGTSIVRCVLSGAGPVRCGDAAGWPLDEALILCMAAPRSSTGEDVVEIQAHGSVAVTAAILEILGQADGFRPADAGEFTHRMFANGKIDLLGTEALADLIESETDLQRQQAWRQMQGALYHPVSGWRDDMIRLGGQR